MSISNKEVIPVFFATNDNYAPFLCVSLTSMFEHASEKYQYKVYVLTTNLNDEYQQMVRDVSAKYADRIDSTVDFVPLKKELDKIQDMFHLRDYYSKETYYRFFVPNLFPQYNKVLYLDCDIIILDDVANLYHTELGDNYVAAAPEEVMTEETVFGDYVEKALGCNRFEYFNAGILLINCQQFREQHICDKFVAMLNEFTFRVTQDEDYLNVLCKDKTVLLSLGWNKTAFKNPKFNDNDLRIVHYKIHWKPWHYAGVAYDNYFWEYAKKTPVYESLLVMQRSYTQAQKDNDQVCYERLKDMAFEDSYDPFSYKKVMDRRRIVSAFTNMVSSFTKKLRATKLFEFISGKDSYGDRESTGQA
jgi:lipopolysaccharide biosynthesis glycosyltransferase